MLYSIVHDPATSAADLNHDLDLIQKWAYQWKMEFNPDPLKQATQMIFSCKRNTTHHPPVFFNGIQVATVDEQKQLCRSHSHPPPQFFEAYSRKNKKCKQAHWHNQIP